MRPRPRPKAGFEPYPDDGWYMCATRRDLRRGAAYPLLGYAVSLSHDLRCGVVLRGRAPTHADVAFVGSCHTCLHTARRLADHRSRPGPAVMGSIRVVRHTQRPGGARHLVGHRHHLRRLGRHHPLQPGRGRTRLHTRVSKHRHGTLHRQGTHIPLAHFGDGTGTVPSARAVLSRRDPDPGGKFPAVPEVRHVRRIGGQRKRRDGPNCQATEDLSYSMDVLYGGPRGKWKEGVARLEFPTRAAFLKGIVIRWSLLRTG